MYIPKGEEERAVFNLRYGLFSWLDAGIGYAVAAEDGEDEVIALELVEERFEISLVGGYAADILELEEPAVSIGLQFDFGEGE